MKMATMCLLRKLHFKSNSDNATENSLKYEESIV